MGTRCMIFTVGIVLCLSRFVYGIDYVTVANSSPAGNYCAFPGACRMADGRIICVFYAGLGHVTTTNQRKGGGAIAYTLSEDDGRTWSEPEMLLDTPMDDRDPSISLLTDRRLMLTYFRLITVPKLAGDGVYVAEIVDVSANARGTREVKRPALSQVLETTHNAGPMLVRNIHKLQHDAGTSSPLRDFGNGLLMLGSYHLDQPYVIRSADNGVTWQVFAIPNGGKHLDAETDVIELETGGGVDNTPGLRQTGLKKRRVQSQDAARPARLFYAVMRGSNCNGHYSTSIDGKNWTVAKDIGFPLHCPELHRVKLAGPNTRDGGSSAARGNAGVYKRPVGPGLVPSVPLSQETVGPRLSAILLAHRVPATAMHYSLDECKTWVGPIQVDSCGGAYPCFVTCKDGSVLIVYYTEGTNSHIRCRRFKLTGKGVVW